MIATRDIDRFFVKNYGQEVKLLIVKRDGRERAIKGIARGSHDRWVIVENNQPKRIKNVLQMESKVVISGFTGYCNENGWVQLI